MTKTELESPKLHLVWQPEIDTYRYVTVEEVLAWTHVTIESNPL